MFDIDRLFTEMPRYNRICLLHGPPLVVHPSLSKQELHEKPETVYRIAGNSGGL